MVEWRFLAGLSILNLAACAINIGYEQVWLVALSALVAGATGTLSIVICEEGHRGP